MKGIIKENLFVMLMPSHSHRDGCFEYHKHMFQLRSKKKKNPTLNYVRNILFYVSLCRAAMAHASLHKYTGLSESSLLAYTKYGRR